MSAMPEIHSLWPLDWDVADTEPWYKSGSIELDGETRWVEAIFRNDRKGQVVVQVLPMRISLGGLLVRHVIPAEEFQPDEHEPDGLMAALMRHLMGRD
jgi:hypothetical protein